MCKLDTCLIYVRGGNYSFCVYWCTFLHAHKFMSEFSSSDFFISIALSAHPAVETALTCPPSAPPPNPSSYRCPIFIASSSQWSGAEPHACNYTPGPVWSSLFWSDGAEELSSMSSPLLWYANQQREKGSRVNKSFDFSMEHMIKINWLM